MNFMNFTNYNFHRLELRHCIAFAKTLMCIIDTLSSKTFRKDNDLCLKKGKVQKYDYTDETYFYIFLGTNDSTRVGCLGTVGTHCFTWNPNSSTVRIDTNDTCYADLSTESDLESVMFQHMLIHKPNEILYLVAFSYLLQNYKSGFTIETDIDEIMDEIPSLKDILEEKDFYQDFRDLYDMHRELSDNE